MQQRPRQPGTAIFSPDGRRLRCTAAVKPKILLPIFTRSMRSGSGAVRSAGRVRGIYDGGPELGGVLLPKLSSSSSCSKSSMSIPPDGSADSFVFVP
jgi:hypothetical protein